MASYQSSTWVTSLRFLLEAWLLQLAQALVLASASLVADLLDGDLSGQGFKSQQTQTLLLKNSELLKGRGRNVSLPQRGAGDIWRQEAFDPVYN